MRSFNVAACAALALSLSLAVAPVYAQGGKMEAKPQPKMAGDKMGGKMAGDKMAAKGPVYVCSQCKMYYSAAQAKKMGYKDPMGHKIVKKDKAPAGYKVGGDKMGGKMGGDKMGGDKMAPKPKM